jgi:hypothetical protein
MSPSSDDPNTTPDAKPETTSTQEPPAEKTAESGGRTGLAGKALPYLAVLAAASAAPASGATTPTAETDRAYLEALLHGSWTQPPDLNARRLPSDATADPAADKFNLAQSFNDTWNPNPQPYSDRLYADSGFGDRTDK